MTRSVTFNGITKFRPGGITRVNANALAQIGLLSNGIVGLIGEADGGLPGATVLDDPALAKETFRSGPLADAIRVAFEPSNDPRVPGGAFRVVAYKVNQTGDGQASRVFSALVPPVFGALSLGGAGATTGQDTVAAASTALVINLTTGALVPNAEVGNHIRIGSEEREIVANIAGQVTVSPAFSVVPATGLAVNIYAMHRHVAAPISTTVITLAAGSALTVDAHIGNQLRLNGEIRTITDNDATTVTVAPAFTGTPVAAQIVDFLSPSFTLTSRDYGVHTNRIKQEFEPGASVGSAWTTSLDDDSQVGEDLGALSYLDIEYVGQSARVLQVSSITDGAGGATTLDDSALAAVINAYTGYFVWVDTDGSLTVPNLRKIASNTAIQITVTNAFTNPGAPGLGSSFEVRTGQILNGLAAAGAARTITMPATIDFAADELANLQIVITGGTGSGQRRVVESNTAGASSVVTVDKAWVTNPDATSTFEMRYVTEANATITGAQGVSTGLSSRVAIDGAAAAADLAITFVQDETLQELINRINQNTNYVATLPGGRNPLDIVSNFDFDNGAFRVEIRNDKATDVVAAFPPTNPPTRWLNHFRKDNAVVIADFAAKNEIVTAALSLGTATQQSPGAGRPEYTGGAIGTVEDTFVYLSGGARGTSTNLDWQTAFDDMIKLRLNHTVPLISQDQSVLGYGSTATFASVMAQFASYINDAIGVEANEQGGYVGMDGTRAQLISQANAFQNADIQLSGQKTTWLDVAGTLKEMAEWALAVAAAGMRSGMDEVGEPLTWKYIGCTTFSQDASWDPDERTDANKFIEEGILFIEEEEGEGFRFVRDLTTWSRDDNLAFAEGSVRDVVRFVSYGLRTTLERLFTGRKAKPTNATGIRDAAAEYLEEARTDNVIVDSTDPDTLEVTYAYHSLRVKISGDIATIRVGIFPSVGINFQLNDIYLQLPTQAA